MNGERIRPDVRRLEDWAEPLGWYAKAVAEMQSRSLNDPTSWRYQAAIHEYRRERDPLASPSDTLPSNPEIETFWNQCQHNSWFFLPWHRMYLAVFEMIVARVVADLGGGSWTLPYWNYSDATNPDARTLPPAFRDIVTPDGVPNPLRVNNRAEGNDGSNVGKPASADLRCLCERSFTPSGVRPGFGGPQTGLNHSGGNARGAVDGVPHGSMHGAVGGWMGAFNTAALDPIFWLHHANIDRLWSVWLKRNSLHVNPADVRWLTDFRFEFNGPGGVSLSFTPAEVVDTTRLPAPLQGYKYQDEGDPLAEGVCPDDLRIRMVEKMEPEMIGATETPVVLTGDTVLRTIETSQPIGPARELLKKSDIAPEFILNFENITGQGDPINYLVYVNLPSGADPADHPEALAGVLPTFGAEEATLSSDEHDSSGLQYALDVSSVVTVGSSHAVPEEIRVTLVPERSVATVENLADTPSSEIRVGRISLHVG
jgi:tyrosinase